MTTSFSKRESIAYLNGLWIPMREAYTHIATHALHYGDSVFEGVRSYEFAHNIGKADYGVLFDEKHADRLIESAQLIWLNTDKVLLHGEEGEPGTLTRGIIMDVEAELLAKNIEIDPRFKNAYIRPFVYGGPEQQGVTSDGPLHFAMFAHIDWSGEGSYSSKTTTASVSPFTRFAPTSIPIQSKVTANYVLGAMAVKEARSRNYKDAFLKAHDGSLADFAGANVFAVIGDKLHTLDAHAFRGITETAIVEKVLPLVSSELGIEFGGAIKLFPKDLGMVREFFCVGTAMEVTPIVKIDDHEFPLGPVTEKMQSVYADLVRTGP